MADRGRRGIFAFIIALACLLPGPAACAAETTAASEPKVAAAPSAPSPSPVEETSLQGMAELLHQRILDVAHNASDTFADLDAAVAAAPGPTTTGWLGPALLDMLITLAIAVVLGELVSRIIRRAWLRGFSATPSSRTETVCFLATRTATGLLAAVLTGLVGFVAGNLLAGNHPAAAMTVMTAVVTAAILRAILSIGANVIVADRPAYRMLAIGDAEARRLWRDFWPTVSICALPFAFAAWVSQLPIDPDAFRLVYVGATALAALALAALVLRHRRPISAAILATSGGPAPAWRRLLAGAWHLAALAYLAVAWLVSATRVLLGQGGGVGLVTSPLAIILVAFALYGLALVIIEAAFRNMATPALHQADGRPLPTFQDLAEQAAAIVIVIAAFTALFHLWGVRLLGSEQTLGVRFFEEILIVLLAYLAYQATRIVIDRHLLAESESHDGASSGHAEEGGHTGASRMATLLHLFRGFALTTIVVMAVMIGLSEIGIDIGPLFAGAGVIGLAIGFGAQTLIRDIFSGAFFLIDDAFRRGEYVDIGIAKGTVERISVRSIQLRHQNGPLDTVPFGAIRNIRNFSRDWVIMKLPLRLATDTDVDKVRRIIKKIGEELAADPEHGPKLLDPVKSQGIYQMDETALIVRIKFKTRPGDQFVLRRLVYAKVQDQFARNGIRFAGREVMVRVAGDQPLTPAVIQQAAAAALPLLAPAEADDSAEAR